MPDNESQPVSRRGANSVGQPGGEQPGAQKRSRESRDWPSAFWASQHPGAWASVVQGAAQSSNNADITQATDGISYGPPWEQTRTVIEGDPHRVFKALKTRLVPVAKRSRHTRQRLYRDKQTGQHWLSLITSIRRCDERRELLKPISPDVAESLFQPLV